MTTPEMIRCKKCNKLVIQKDGIWKCDEIDIDIHKIPDDECPLDEEY